MHRRRGTRDEDEAHLEVSAYEALGLRSALRERPEYAAACYELAHLVRIGHEVSSRAVRGGLFADSLWACQQLGAWPDSREASAAARALCCAASASLPAARGGAVVAAHKAAKIEQRRASTRTARLGSYSAEEVQSLLEDVLPFVLSVCDARSLARCACVNCAWRGAATRTDFWRPLLARSFPVASADGDIAGGCAYASFVRCASEAPRLACAALAPRLLCPACGRLAWRSEQAGAALAVRCGRLRRSCTLAGASPEQAAHATLRRYDVRCTVWNAPRDVAGGPGAGATSSDEEEVATRGGQRRLWSFPSLNAGGAVT